MASGRNIGGPDSDDNCLGKTGLALQSEDDFEKLGCKYNDDNFLKFLSAKSGENYVLFINNYNSKEGFSITFEGDAEFSKPKDCKNLDMEQKVQITHLYPNPALDKLNVQFVSQSKGEYKIEILSIQGETIMEVEETSNIGLNHRSLEVFDMPSGSYILQITHGDYSTAKKFVKQ